MRKQARITDRELQETTDRCYHFFSRVYGLEENDKDDIKQEIAIRIWRNQDRFHGGSWSNFCLTLAKRAIQSYFREAPRVGLRWSRGASEKISTAPLDELVVEPGRTEPYEALNIVEELSDLTKRERAVAFLAMMGYSWREIASCLRTSESAVAQIVWRLRIANTPSSSSPDTDTQPRKRAA